MKNSKGFSSGTDLRRRIFTILITVLAVACMIPRFGVRAANPSSGTLNASDTTPKTWVGTATGPSSPQGESTCAEGVNCDTYILTLSTAATWVGKKARVRISWIAGADDFDLYIHKCPAGSSTPSDCNATAVVASSTQGAPTTSEQADIDPNSSGTGDYSVHVVYFTATLGDEYNGSASVFIPPNASKPPSTEPGPIYINYQSPAGLGDSSGEPSIGVDWGTGIVMFQAVLQTLRVSFDDSVPPATASWALKNGPNTSTTSLDPILFTDSKTGRTLVAQLASTQSLSAFTDNDGFNYTPNQGGGPASGVDHQTYGGGPFKPGIAGRLPTTSYPNAVYYASQDIGTATCSLSRDGGLTFQQETPMWTATQCGGLHGHIKVAPNGTVYVPNKSCSSTQAVAVSVNNGLTWTIRQVPNSSPPPAGGSDPSVGIGAGGKLYFGYVNSDGTPHVAVSDDQGITWHDDQNVGDDPHWRRSTPGDRQRH